MKTTVFVKKNVRKTVTTFTGKAKTGQSYNLNNSAAWPTLTQSSAKAQVKPKGTIPASFW